MRRLWLVALLLGQACGTASTAGEFYVPKGCVLLDLNAQEGMERELLEYFREQVRYLYVVLTNRGGVSATVNCTLVEGFAGQGWRYYPKSVTLAPGEINIHFRWTIDENDNIPFEFPAISCALPPAVEINGVSQMFFETVS